MSSEIESNSTNIFSSIGIVRLSNLSCKWIYLMYLFYLKQCEKSDISTTISESLLLAVTLFESHSISSVSNIWNKQIFFKDFVHIIILGKPYLHKIQFFTCHFSRTMIPSSLDCIKKILPSHIRSRQRITGMLKLPKLINNLHHIRSGPSLNLRTSSNTINNFNSTSPYAMDRSYYKFIRSIL